MLNITHYQRNANQNHNEVPSHASQNGCNDILKLICKGYFSISLQKVELFTAMDFYRIFFFKLLSFYFVLEYSWLYNSAMDFYRILFFKLLSFYFVLEYSWLYNSAVATGLEKVSFHSNPKERQCQRMLKLPHNCTHLTRW